MGIVTKRGADPDKTMEIQSVKDNESFCYSCLATEFNLLDRNDSRIKEFTLPTEISNQKVHLEDKLDCGQRQLRVIQWLTNFATIQFSPIG